MNQSWDNLFPFYNMPKDIDILKDPWWHLPLEYEDAKIHLYPSEDRHIDDLVGNSKVLTFFYEYCHCFLPSKCILMALAISRRKLLSTFLNKHWYYCTFWTVEYEGAKVLKNVKNILMIPSTILDSPWICNYFPSI